MFQSWRVEMPREEQVMFAKCTALDQWMEAAQRRSLVKGMQQEGVTKERMQEHL
jgi:hypothetical protein